MTAELRLECTSAFYSGFFIRAAFCEKVIKARLKIFFKYVEKKICIFLAFVIKYIG